MGGVLLCGEIPPAVDGMEIFVVFFSVKYSSG